MSQEIERYRGLVLQFIGDEIEAVFGAPLALEHHPAIAVEVARAMRKRLVELNRTWEAQGKEPFHHGIGIHTGEVVAASIGSPERLSYLMVGDTVNLASRIQGMTKELDCDILISDETRRFLSDRVPLRSAGTVRVRGKQQHTELFELL
jgi:adenylate cyclase